MGLRVFCSPFEFDGVIRECKTICAGIMLSGSAAYEFKFGSEIARPPGEP